MIDWIQVMFDRTVYAVSVVFEIDRAFMLGPRRTALQADARSVVAWILCNSGVKPQKVADLLQKDRSTIVHSVAKARALFKEEISDVVRLLQNYSEHSLVVQAEAGARS